MTTLKSGAQVLDLLRERDELAIGAGRRLACVEDLALERTQVRLPVADLVECGRRGRNGGQRVGRAVGSGAGRRVHAVRAADGCAARPSEPVEQRAELPHPPSALPLVTPRPGELVMTR